MRKTNKLMMIGLMILYILLQSQIITAWTVYSQSHGVTVGTSLASDSQRAGQTILIKGTSRQSYILANVTRAAGVTATRASIFKQGNITALETTTNITGDEFAFSGNTIVYNQSKYIILLDSNGTGYTRYWSNSISPYPISNTEINWLASTYQTWGSTSEFGNISDRVMNIISLKLTEVPEESSPTSITASLQENRTYTFNQTPLFNGSATGFAYNATIYLYINNSLASSLLVNDTKVYNFTTSSLTFFNEYCWFMTANNSKGGVTSPVNCFYLANQSGTGQNCTITGVSTKKCTFSAGSIALSTMTSCI